MAGRRTIQFLAPATYPTFYQLAHAFSEEVLCQMATIDGAAHILTILCQRFPAATADEAARVSEAAASAVQLQGAAKQAVKDVRRCFWPEENHDTVNESRWFPYDHKAWDAFFGEVIGVSEPHLRELTTCLEQVRAVGGVDAGAAPAGTTEAAWRDIEEMAVASLLKLQTVLTPAGLEARVFRN